MDEPDEPPIYARHLLVCRDVSYNPDKPGEAYSLRDLVTKIRLDDDFGYPLFVERLWLFAQVFGQHGTYPAWIELYRIVDDAAGLETQVVRFGPLSIIVREAQFVEGASFQLSGVPFPAPGLYEFRLMIDGYNAPLATERILLET